MTKPGTKEHFIEVCQRIFPPLLNKWERERMEQLLAEPKERLEETAEIAGAHK